MQCPYPNCEQAPYAQAASLIKHLQTHEASSLQAHERESFEMEVKRIRDGYYSSDAGKKATLTCPFPDCEQAPYARASFLLKHLQTHDTTTLTGADRELYESEVKKIKEAHDAGKKAATLQCPFPGCDQPAYAQAASLVKHFQVHDASTLSQVDRETYEAEMKKIRDAYHNSESGKRATLTCPFPQCRQAPYSHASSFFNHCTTHDPTTLTQAERDTFEVEMKKIRDACEAGKRPATLPCPFPGCDQPPYAQAASLIKHLAGHDSSGLGQVERDMYETEAKKIRDSYDASNAGKLTVRRKRAVAGDDPSPRVSFLQCSTMRACMGSLLQLWERAGLALRAGR